MDTAEFENFLLLNNGFTSQLSGALQYPLVSFVGISSIFLLWQWKHDWVIPPEITAASPPLFLVSERDWENSGFSSSQETKRVDYLSLQEVQVPWEQWSESGFPPQYSNGKVFIPLSCCVLLSPKRLFCFFSKISMNSLGHKVAKTSYLCATHGSNTWKARGKMRGKEDGPAHLHPNATYSSTSCQNPSSWSSSFQENKRLGCEITQGNCVQLLGRWQLPTSVRVTS